MGDGDTLETGAEPRPPQGWPSLVQYWAGNSEPEIDRLCELWKDLYPELKYQRHDYDSAAAFIRDNLPREMAAAFHKCKLPAMQSDVFRLCYAYSVGGFYVDCGTRPVARFPLTTGPLPGELYLLRMDTGRIWNGLILAHARHPALAKILEQVISNVLNERDHFGRPSNDVLSVTGPVNYQDLRTPRNRDKYKVTLFDEDGYLERVQDLKHKRPGWHWQCRQRAESIYETSGAD